MRVNRVMGRPCQSCWKKSLPLSSTSMNAGKSSTSMRKIASIPSSGYSRTSTLRMCSFARIAAARRDRIDVAFDRYPYTAYQTGLSNLFPTWSRDGGTVAFLARLEGSCRTPIAGLATVVGDAIEFSATAPPRTSFTATVTPNPLASA